MLKKKKEVELFYYTAEEENKGLREYCLEVMLANIGWTFTISINEWD